jgi:cyclic pyranopterin phosphate synthase
MCNRGARLRHLGRAQPASPTRGIIRADVAAKLSHSDARGRARMIDVAAKPETLREAVASAEVRMQPATLRLVERAVGARGKGDVLAVARLAGLMAAKRTADLIPLCHPVRLVGCEVELRADRALPGVRIQARARAVDRTGVEMEAMVAAAVAALTVYDMVKGAERGVEIRAVRLDEKRGGKSGVWERQPAMKPIANRRSSK